jgi:hypothetical protein
MADITRGTGTLGQVATTRTVSEIHPANIDFWAISGKVAGEGPMYSGQLVYLHTDDKFYFTDCNSGTAADKKCHGVVVNDCLAADRPVTVMQLGTMGGYTGLTQGGIIYGSDTEGEVANAVSSTTPIIVGICVSDTEIFFFPQLAMALNAVYAAALAAAIAAD